MKEHLDNEDVTDTDIITILDVCEDIVKSKDEDIVKSKDEDIVKSKDEDFVALSITTRDDTEVYDQGTDGDYFHVHGYTEA